MNDRFFCESCCHRYGDLGDCPDCSGEPLLDLADEDIRLFLTERDETVSSKRNYICSLIAGFASIIPAFYLAHLLTPDRSSGEMGLMMAFGFFAAGLAGGSTVLMSIFPPVQKMPYVDGSEIDKWNRN